MPLMFDRLKCIFCGEEPDGYCPGCKKALCRTHNHPHVWANCYWRKSWQPVEG